MAEAYTHETGMGRLRRVYDPFLRPLAMRYHSRVKRLVSTIVTLCVTDTYDQELETQGPQRIISKRDQKW
jgi:hypothetical protein